MLVAPLPHLVDPVIRPAAHLMVRCEHDELALVAALLDDPPRIAGLCDVQHTLKCAELANTAVLINGGWGPLSRGGELPTTTWFVGKGGTLLHGLGRHMMAHRRLQHQVCRCRLWRRAIQCKRTYALHCEDVLR